MTITPRNSVQIMNDGPCVENVEVRPHPAMHFLLTRCPFPAESLRRITPCVNLTSPTSSLRVFKGAYAARYGTCDTRTIPPHRRRRPSVHKSRSTPSGPHRTSMPSLRFSETFTTSPVPRRLDSTRRISSGWSAHTPAAANLASVVHATGATLPVSSPTELARSSF